jgi:hypothetical protein
MREGKAALPVPRRESMADLWASDCTTATGF